MAGYQDTPNASGSVMVKTVFFPNSLATAMVPPQRSTMLLQTAKPSPMPACPSARLTKERQKDTREVFWWYSDTSVSYTRSQLPRHCWFRSQY
jgi:hypothetical protein